MTDIAANAPRLRHPAMELLGRYRAIFKAAWQHRRELSGPDRLADEAAFLPAALSLQETPVHPAPRRLALALVALFLIALAWSIVGQVDIVAVAPGRIVVSERTKVIQPLQVSVVQRVLVKDGDRVEAGQPLVELDPTSANADKTSVDEQLKSAQSEVLRTRTLMQALAAPTSSVDLAAKLILAVWSPEDTRAARAQLAAEWSDITARLAKFSAEIARRQAEIATVREMVAKLDANNVLDGGLGFDTVSYANASASVSVFSDFTGAQNTGGSGTDTLRNIERVVGCNFDDALTGGGGVDHLVGGGGNDGLWGNAGSDSLDGDAGNDNLIGCDGDDSLFGGTGVDNLWGEFGNDRLDGGAGDDSLTGGDGNDTLAGGEGTDRLWGNGGNDTYVLGRGDGSDSIVENDATAGNADVASFGADIASDQLWFSQAGNDLEIRVIGSGDKFSVSNWYSGSQYHVEQFKTSDGKTLLDSQVQNLVQAMAGFAPPAAGQTTLPANYQSSLNAVIAANWQ